MKIDNHWLVNARHLLSPNYDQRPDPDDISLLVIHCISLPPGQFGGDAIDRLFSNRLEPEAHPYFQEIHEFKVSAHVLIRRHGELVQYVPFDQRAWHAGESVYRGRNRCNDFSIGIELEGTETSPYTERQYRQLARLAGGLIQRYPRLSPGEVCGHSDIAPQRKRDPGPAFDWSRFRRLLAAELGSTEVIAGVGGQGVSEAVDK